MVTPVNDSATVPDTEPETNSPSGQSDSTVQSGDDSRSASEIIVKKPMNSTEIGGRGGPDPTRYGDWEKAGRCIDF